MRTVRASRGDMRTVRASRVYMRTVRGSPGVYENSKSITMGI